jgi:DNA-binding response OmpR family regulator
MLTARDSLADKLAGFDAGTDDYLVKPFELIELAARVKALAKRRSLLAQQLEVGPLQMDFVFEDRVPAWSDTHLDANLLDVTRNLDERISERREP